MSYYRHMYTGNLEKLILVQSEKYRCITFVGPRQSGKTTLAKKLFPEYKYYSFESPNTLEFFRLDPIGFLDGLNTSAIFDEVQKVPELLSYLQEVLDDKKDKRKFVFTGSNNLKLSHKVSQSLAGRTKIFQILPLERNEIAKSDIFEDLDKTLFYGSYPRIYDEKLSPTDWLGDYLNTYIEKDIRDTAGHEIDLVIDLGVSLDLIEIKSGKTFQTEFLANMKWLNKLQEKDRGTCIYGGNEKMTLGNYEIIPWDFFINGSSY
jgi:uncharacterized protein